MFKPVQIPSTITPRSYQNKFLDTAHEQLHYHPNQWHLFSAPTNTGKSLCELMFLQAFPNSILVTPRLEIIAGMLDKLGHYVDDLTDKQLIDISWQYGIITPVRLRNILAKGELSFQPSYICLDEAHHSLAESWEDLHMYLNGCPVIGLTATPYRGTPKGTKKFREQWGNKVHEIISLKDSVKQGYFHIPKTVMWPLVDDDTIDVTNGEFNVTKADEVIIDRIKALVNRCTVSRFYCKNSKLWDKPTIFSVPSTETAIQLTNELNNAGLATSVVIQSTPRKLRRNIFQKLVNCSTAIVQIDVVSEGVDLPVRRIVDIRPTMSPVKWIQQVGRIRAVPDDPTPPEYICCCRNLERHAYLMEGHLPNSSVKEAQEAFGDCLPSANDPTKFDYNLTKRMGVRAVGLEGLGRFTYSHVQLLNGLWCITYNLVHVDGFSRNEYYVLVHPNFPEPVYGIKTSTVDQSTNEMKWGHWRVIESIPDLKGCSTLQIKNEEFLSEKQRNRWTEDAERLGLNPHQQVTNRKLQSLFFLRNTGLRFS
jgi:hypothetical protein